MTDALQRMPVGHYRVPRMNRTDVVELSRASTAGLPGGTRHMKAGGGTITTTLERI